MSRTRERARFPVPVRSRAPGRAVARSAVATRPARAGLSANGVAVFTVAAVLHAGFLIWYHFGPGQGGAGLHDAGRGMIFLLGLVVPPALFVWGALAAAEGDERHHSIWEGMLCVVGLAAWAMWFFGGGWG